MILPVLSDLAVLLEVILPVLSGLVGGDSASPVRPYSLVEIFFAGIRSKTFFKFVK